MRLWKRILVTSLIFIGSLTLFCAIHEMGHVWIARHKDNGNVTEVCFIGINFEESKKNSFLMSPIGWAYFEIESDKNASVWHDYWDFGLGD